jgi:hypothetical protein
LWGGSPRAAPGGLAPPEKADGGVGRGTGVPPHQETMEQWVGYGWRAPPMGVSCALMCVESRSFSRQ